MSTVTSRRCFIYIKGGGNGNCSLIYIDAFQVSKFKSKGSITISFVCLCPWRGGAKKWRMTTASFSGSNGAAKTVLVTGVSKGLGRALALELSKRGHTVIGCSRAQEKLNSLQSELAAPDRHLLLNVDVVRPLFATPLLCSFYRLLCFLAIEMIFFSFFVWICRGRIAASRS